MNKALKKIRSNLHYNNNSFYSKKSHLLINHSSSALQLPIEPFITPQKNSQHCFSLSILHNPKKIFKSKTNHGTNVSMVQVKRISLLLSKPKCSKAIVIISPESFQKEIEKNTFANFNNKYNFLFKKKDNERNKTINEAIVTSALNSLSKRRQDSSLFQRVKNISIDKSKSNIIRRSYDAIINEGIHEKSCIETQSHRKITVNLLENSMCKSNSLLPEINHI